MKNKKLQLVVILLLGAGLSGVYAQEVIPASGGNASGGGGSVSYTLGQVVYTTHTGTTGSAAQGVQQPFEISVVTGIAEDNGKNLICSAFPVPAKNYVILKTENYKAGNLWYLLYDESGKLLENKKVQGIETSIDMSNLVIATYFLMVRLNDKVVKTFKIIKY